MIHTSRVKLLIEELERIESPSGLSQLENVAQSSMASIASYDTIIPELVSAV